MDWWAKVAAWWTPTRRRRLYLLLAALGPVLIGGGRVTAAEWSVVMEVVGVLTGTGGLVMAGAYTREQVKAAGGDDQA